MNLLYIIFLHLQIAAIKLQIAAQSHDAVLIAQASAEAIQTVQEAENALNTPPITPEPSPAPSPAPNPVPAPSPVPTPTPAPQDQNLGVATEPIQLSWKDIGGSVNYGFNGVDYPWNINEPSTIFNVFIGNGKKAQSMVINSATLTINGQTYNANLRPDVIAREAEFGVLGLVSGDYPYTLQVNSSGTYSILSDVVSVP